MYINVHLDNTWITFLHIFKHCFFGTTKKHFFPASKKNVVKCVCKKNTFWNILSHLIFLAHFNNILLAFICLVSASVVFFQKMFSYVHFSKKCYPNVQKCTKMLSQCIQMYIFAHFMHILYIRNNKFTTKTTKKQ